MIQTGKPIITGGNNLYAHKDIINRKNQQG